MNTRLQCGVAAAVAVSLLILTLGVSGCGRDTRVNSDPGPGRPSRADGGDKAVRPDPNQATPSQGSTAPSTGTDSTGRPSGASGGTTGADASSGTGGAGSGQRDAPDRK